MQKLKTKPTLKDIQRHIAKAEAEWGFSSDTARDKVLRLFEEVGEVSKAVHKKEKGKIDPRSAVGEVSLELADVFIYATEIANRYGIDLEKAVRDKVEINNKRTWK